MLKSKLRFSHTLPANLDWENSILLFDAVLLAKHKNWIQRFPNRVSLKSGEALKDLTHFAPKMQKIVQLSSGMARADITIVGFGGGSVGDFAGFVASILKRGVKLVHVPSTWLAAVDSAHGGKTAMNVARLKNQVGTFYSAQNVHLVREVLLRQPADRAQDVAGEYYKTALLAGGALWKKAPYASQLTPQRLWADLPQLIRYKYRIVGIDPYEIKGQRAFLNLGHTVGHVFEAALGLSHGRAVHLGLLFALKFGRERGVTRFEWPHEMLPSDAELQALLRKIKNPAHWLRQDKKMHKADRIRFVFVRKPGYPALQAVTIGDLQNEWTRQSRATKV